MIQFNENIFQFGGSTRDATCIILGVQWPKPATGVAASQGQKTRGSFAIREVRKIQRIIQVRGPETKSCVCFIYLSFGGYIHDIILLYDIHTYIHIYNIHVTYAFNTYVPNLYRLISFSQGFWTNSFAFNFRFRSAHLTL